MKIINLLPWREAKRKQHQRRFIAMLIAALFLGYSTSHLLNLRLAGEVSTQQQRVAYLQSEIDDYRRQIQALSSTKSEQQSLEARLDYVDGLQQQRNKTTAVMNLLPTLIPSQVYVDKIRMQGEQFKVSGIGESTAFLAQMLDRFEQSTMVNNVVLHSIVHDRERFGNKYQAFELSFAINSAALLTNPAQPPKAGVN